MHEGILTKYKVARRRSAWRITRWWLWRRTNYICVHIYIFILFQISQTDVKIGEDGEASHSQIFSNLRESWSKVSHAVRELVTVFSLTFSLATIVGQLVRIPSLTKGVSAHHWAETPTRVSNFNNGATPSWALLGITPSLEQIVFSAIIQPQSSGSKSKDSHSYAKFCIVQRLIAN